MKTPAWLALVAPLVLLGCEPDYLDLGEDDQPITTGSTTTSTTLALCTPGEKRECYTGPEGTEGQGICKAGEETCNAEGTAFGSCEKEQLPEQEDCTTLQIDEDCDGVTTCEEKTWARRFGDTQDQLGRGVAVNSAGDIALVGSFAGAIDFGEFFLSSPDGDDGFIARLDPDGNPVWSRQIGGASNQAASAVALDETGNVVAGGLFQGTIDVAGKTLTANGLDFFVAKLGPRSELLWAKSVTGTQVQYLTSLSTDTEGNIFLTGFFNGLADFDGYQLQGTADLDAFVAKLDPAGSLLWAKAFGGPGEQRATAAAFDETGAALITGDFIGTIDFGDGPSPVASSRNVFVVKLASDGATAWAKTYPGSANQRATAIAAAPSGAWVMAGELSGTLDLGGAVLEAAPGAIETFVAAFDATGLHLWSHRFGQTQLRSLARGAEGATFLAGSVIDPIDFGAGVLPSNGSADVFLAVFDPVGTLLSQRRWGDASSQENLAVAATSTGKAILAGSFAGVLDFGSGPLTSAGGRDVFVAKVAP